MAGTSQGRDHHSSLITRSPNTILLSTCPHHEHYRIARYVTALEHEACRYTSVIWTWEISPKVSKEVVKMFQYFIRKLRSSHNVIFHQLALQVALLDKLNYFPPPSSLVMVLSVTMRNSPDLATLSASFNQNYNSQTVVSTCRRETVN